MIPNQQLVIPQWLALSQFQRQQLIANFGIPRSEGSNVVDNTVVSDGHTHEDLAHITIEKMQEFTGSKSDDFFTLFDETLDTLKKPEVPQPTAPVQPEVKVTVQVGDKVYTAEEHRKEGDKIAKAVFDAGFTAEPVKKKGGRPRKQK